MIIHQFGKKLLQKSIFPYFREYLLWQSKKGRAPEFAPISINLDLTTACNFQCPHCIDMDIINTGKMLDLAYIKALLADWGKKGLKSVILIGGGEPTLYPYFGEVVRFLKRMAFRVGIVSNGTMLKKIEEVLQILGKKDWLRFSLDAGTDETFQKLHRPRVQANLTEIMAGVRRIRQKNHDLQIGYSFLIIGRGRKAGGVKLIENIKEIVPAAKLAKENGFSYLSLKPFISPEGERATVIPPADLEKIKAEIREAKKLEDENFKVVESINLLCFYDKALAKIMQRQPKTCHAGFFRSVVIPAGVFSCSLWRGFASTKISKTNQKINKDYYKVLYRNRAKLLETFNAQKNCKSVSCLYAPLNCWIEDLINSPQKIKELKPINDFGDYFL